MKVALIGSTGFIGQGVLACLVADGHVVRALARHPSRVRQQNGLTVIGGDALNLEAVDQTVAGCEAVVSTLGTRRGEDVDPDFLAQAARNVLQAMRNHGVNRLVAVSGAGITVPGERKPFPHNVISRLLRMLARNAVESKQREYDVLAGSEVEWTAVRPVRVQDVPASGSVRTGTSAEHLGTRVSRDDLARFIVDQLHDRTFVHQAPFISA
ncbi:MAG: NAD(P)H-binding protein [Candidatus Dormibacteraeota bacterium]|nr:NAD(P)H-binding protein [Candidatus Dormibacteraeota bacterium]